MKQIKYGEFEVEDEGKIGYIVGHSQHTCPKCQGKDVLSFGIPINNNTEIMFSFHWCACGHKWMDESK